MQAKVLNEFGERTMVLVFDSGEEPVAALTRFAQEHKLDASRFTAIGAFDQVVCGYFDWETKTYKENAVFEQVEVLSLIGNIALDGERPRVHAHVVVGKRDGSTLGGHLLSARVRPTLEVVLVESPRYMKRVFDRGVGLALIDLEA